MLRARGRQGDEERADELRHRAHAIADELAVELPDDENWPVNLQETPA